MLKVLELFGGIGAPRMALQELGMDFKVVDYVDVDSYAVKSYNAIYDETYEPQDVREWNKDIEVDLIFHGSPCTDFSLAGTQKGGDEGSGTQSSLMYESVRIIQKLKPKYVIWENVKNVVSKTHFHNFSKYLNVLADIGYNNNYFILNAKDYGVPQNRERVFVISILGDEDFLFSPKKVENNLSLFIQADEEVEEKFFSKDNVSIDNNDSLLFIDRIYKNRPPKITKNCPTLRAARQGVEIARNGKIIRKLTPLEYWQLMGFKKEYFIKAKSVCSNTQLYKQAGNSIVVPVLKEIFEQLFMENNLRK